MAGPRGAAPQLSGLRHPLATALVVAGAALVAAPLVSLVLIAFGGDRELWPHLAAHVLPVAAANTALLLAGVLFAQSYFSEKHPVEGRIRDLAEKIYSRVEWPWAQANAGGITLAWRPETGFHAVNWKGYNEAMIVYLLALGGLYGAIEYSGTIDTRLRALLNVQVAALYGVPY